MRKKFSTGCLVFAWLCANGAVWNVVQVVAWAKMLHDYSQVMPAAKALQVTFDGSAPCNLCHLSQAARDAARDQMPRDAAVGSEDRVLLVCQVASAMILSPPVSAWPEVGGAAGPERTATVPVPPPRA